MQHDSKSLHLDNIEERLLPRIISKVFWDSDALIIVVDSRGRVLQFNPACERLTGYTMAEVCKQPIWDLLPGPEVTARVRQDIASMEAGTYPNRQAEPWITKDRSEVLISWSNSVLVDEESGVSLMIGVGSDVTDHTRANDAMERSEARLDSVTKAAGDAIVTGDDKGRITGWNPAAERLFGYAKLEVLGKPLTLLIPSQFKPLHLSAFEHRRNPATLPVSGQPVEVLALRKGGAEFPVQLSLGSWEEGGHRCFVSIIRDLTEAKEAAARHEALQIELEESLTKVLAGFLPICSHCKSIRDEKDNWSPLEDFIHERSDVTLSHGICPVCLKTHYSDLADD
jgi:two-component system sensor kinase FixL